MTHDKNGIKIYMGEIVQYEGKLWTFESQMGGHINLRNTAGDLITTKAGLVEGDRSLGSKGPQAQVGPTTTENVESGPPSEESKGGE